jgi:hypothetical protein
MKTKEIIYRKNSKTVLFIAIAVIATLWLIAPVLFGKRLFSGLYTQLLHVYFFNAQQYLIFKLGVWPTWWPNFFSGYPINLTLDGFLNPLFILALKYLPALTAHNWLIYLFWIVNIISCYAFARALKLSWLASAITAITYGFSGIYIRWTDTIVFTVVYAILPLSCLACLRISEGSRRWWWAWIAILSFGWIGGFAELMVYQLLAVGGFCLWLLFTNPRFNPNSWKSHPFKTVVDFISQGFGRYFLPVLLSLLVVSPWLVSVLYYISVWSNRAGGIGLENSSAMPLTLSYVIHMFLPRLSVVYGGNIPYLTLGDDIDLVLGTMPVLLLLTLPLTWRSNQPRHRMYFFILLIFSILMAFRSPIYGLIHSLPILRWFRWHFKWTFLTTFAAAVLTGFAVDSLDTFWRHRHAKLYLRAIWIALGLFGVSLIGMTLFSEPIKQAIESYATAHYRDAASQMPLAAARSTEYYGRIITAMSASFVKGFSLREVWTSISFFLWFVSLAIFTWVIKNNYQTKLAKIGLLTMSLIGTVGIWTGFLVGLPVSFLTKEPETARYLHTENPYHSLPLTGDTSIATEPYRVMQYFPDQIYAELQDRHKILLIDAMTSAHLSKEMLENNMNTWFQIDGFFNHEPLAVRSALSVFEHAIWVDRPGGRGSLSEQVARFSSIENARLLGSQNVKYVLTLTELSAPWKLGHTSPTMEARIPVYIYENPYFRSRWYLADDVRWSPPSDNGTLKMTRSAMEEISEADNRTVLERQNPADEIMYTSSSTDDRLILQYYTAGRLSLKTETRGYRWVVFAETYFPFWKATIDGEHTKIYRANINGQAILVPPGKHDIEFAYQDMLTMARLSLVGLLTSR